MFASNAASLASQSSTFEGIRQGSNAEKLGKVDFALLRKIVVFYVCLQEMFARFTTIEDWNPFFNGHGIGGRIECITLSSC